MVALKEEFYNKDTFPDWLIKLLNIRSTVTSGLSRDGIDLANAIYYQDKMLVSNRDSRIRDPNKIHIIKFVSSEDPYVFRIDPDGNKKVYWDPWVYRYDKDASKVPFYKLLDVAQEYGYLDLSDPSDLFNKRADRSELKKGATAFDRNPKYGQKHVKITHRNYPSRSDYDPNLSRGAEIVDRYAWKDSWGNHDKSGYLLNPNKYKLMLNSVGLKDYEFRLDKMYRILNKLRKEVTKLNAESIEFDTIRNPNNYFYKRNIELLTDVYDYFNSCITTYRDLLSCCEFATNSLESGEFDYARADSYITNQFQNRYDSFKNKCKSVTNSIERFKKNIEDSKINNN